ncbi:MAG: flagellar M-ring protein FliF [Firmicutes bacterium]|nr:flagellar M-ring protein FliF [Bacillota bacterium]
MEKIREITGKVKGGWDNIDKKKKKALIAVLVSAVVLTSFYTWYSTRVTYTPLFTNLELDDAADITADLDSKGDIRYKLENGGKDIYIDEAYVDKYRLELATKGLMPESSTGFEIFDDASMMVTDEDRKIMYQRALEGELQRSVMSLDEIQSARVHLVMSEESIFDSEKSEASASVIVDIKAGKNLDDDSVMGIVALISGAVDNLPEANVKVIDSSGNILNLGMASESGGKGAASYAEQSEIKSSFEAKLENNILNLLGPAFGVDNIKVTVYADLDFDAQEQTVITYSDPVVRSEQKSATGSGVDSGAVSGDSVSDSTQNVLESGDSEGLATYDGTVNYELSQSTTNTVRAPGQVKKITTSIIYDGNLSDDQKASILNLAATATGYDANRGDLINIEGVIFDESYQGGQGETAEEEASASFFEKNKYLIFIGGFIGLAVLLLVVKAVLGRRKKDEAAQFETGTPVKVGGNVDIIDEIYRSKVEKSFEVRENQKEKQVKEYVQGHPEIAADLIKAWLKD